MIRAALQSPVQLFALGINYSQRERILEAENMTDMVRFVLLYLKRIATTDLEKNWFAWYAAAGRYKPRAGTMRCPPYLRPDHFERSSPCRQHRDLPPHESLRRTSRALGAIRWSHFTLCDATDWMSPGTQRKLFREIFRTSRDGARVLFRSVEPDSLVDRLELQKHFVWDEAASRLANRP